MKKSLDVVDSYSLNDISKKMNINISFVIACYIVDTKNYVDSIKNISMNDAEELWDNSVATVKRCIEKNRKLETFKVLRKNYYSLN